MVRVKRLLVTAASISLLLAATTVAIKAEETKGAEQHAHAYQSDASINIMDPSSWFKNAPKPGTTMAFNPAHPAGWAVVLNPRTHTTWHMAITNPATYAQFMQPQFWMQFMNPQNVMAWMNPASYATFMDPNTYMYWMTPNAYVHALNPDNYMQMMNPDNYAKLFAPEVFNSWMNLNSYTPTSAKPTGIIEGGAGQNYLASWFGAFQPQGAKTQTQ